MVSQNYYHITTHEEKCMRKLGKWNSIKKVFYRNQKTNC